MTTPNSNDPTAPNIDRQAEVTAEDIRASGTSTMDRPMDPMGSTGSFAGDTSASDGLMSSDSDDFGTNVGMVIEEEVGFVAEPEERQRSQGGSRMCNVGRTEQKFRLGAGTALLVAAALAPVSRGWKIGFAVVGAAELITGSLRYCPISQALGINTCHDDEA